MSKYEWFYKDEVIEKEVSFAMQMLKLLKNDDDNMKFIFDAGDFLSDSTAQKAIENVMTSYATYYMDRYDMSIEDHILRVDEIGENDFK